MPCHQAACPTSSCRAYSASSRCACSSGGARRCSAGTGRSRRPSRADSGLGVCAASTCRAQYCKGMSARGNMNKPRGTGTAVRDCHRDAPVFLHAGKRACLQPALLLAVPQQRHLPLPARGSAALPRPGAGRHASPDSRGRGPSPAGTPAGSQSGGPSPPVPRPCGAQPLQGAQGPVPRGQQGTEPPGLPLHPTGPPLVGLQDGSAGLT